MSSTNPSLPPGRRRLGGRGALLSNVRQQKYFLDSVADATRLQFLQETGQASPRQTSILSITENSRFRRNKEAVFSQGAHRLQLEATGDVIILSVIARYSFALFLVPHSGNLAAKPTPPPRRSPSLSGWRNHVYSIPSFTCPASIKP